ncbi:MAG: penicillin acylase family protein, partial [Planctomycetes bacterium]|nr:penicillin acylase family protein [Planctomycetota bacterium]
PVHGADAAAAPRLRPVPGAAAAIAAAERHLAAARPPGRAASAGHSGICGSNNWAVSGARTASGKPILASDPHLGFQLPSIWYAWHAAVKGRAVAGAGFPVSPVVIIGHNDRAGWGLTNMQADAVDYFVETLRPGDPLVAGDPPRYLHRGEWKPVERSSEEIAVRGEAPRAVQVDATVHGPIVAREGEGRAVALAWTGLGPTREVVALWKMNRASGLGELLEALDELAVPAMNVACADLDGNIALHPCGALPLRTPGQGRIPMDGASGEGDWAGMIPRTELPLAVNPPEGFVASANGRPAPLGYPHYLGWMWDPSYRARRIQEMLSRASGLTVASMAAIQLDVHDEAAERFLPPLLAALDPRSLEDDAARRATAALRDWDYAARGDSPAPALWLEWLRRYRDLVWGDEWRARGIETEPGSWGYTSDNRREPVLEVLEYMTREHPRSAWFDDRATPAREGRDEIAARAFIAAVSSLRRRLGDDMSLWAWTRRNVLRIPSLTGDAPLERVGGPVPGSAFTVNPGGDGDGVGGGASWRMIVDFGDPTASAGAYPGGQSEDPASPHYDDLIPLWAAGRYVQLHCVTAPERLPPEARSKTLRLVP